MRRHSGGVKDYGDYHKCSTRLLVSYNLGFISIPSAVIPVIENFALILLRSGNKVTALNLGQMRQDIEIVDLCFSLGCCPKLQKNPSCSLCIITYMNLILRLVFISIMRELKPNA